MATATHTGPIGIEQINNMFYVTGGEAGGDVGDGFITIQAAVDYVRTYASGLGIIIVCQGTPYGEDIGAITGGVRTMVICDQRDSLYQSWLWNDTKFVPSNFVQLGTIAAQNYIANNTGVSAQVVDGTALFDFWKEEDSGRLFARSITPALGGIILMGASNFADSRSIEYVVFSEPSGPGSAIATFNVPIHAPSAVIGGDLIIDGVVLADGLNTTLYVWGANGTIGFTTPQEAMDRLNVLTGGNGVIDLIHGSSDTFDIGAITGGTASTTVIDHRHGASQNYYWNGTQLQFQAQDFTQFGSISAQCYYASATGTDIKFADGTTLLDFWTNEEAGRLAARSTTSALAKIILMGATNLAESRSIEYVVFSEPSGPGSAIATFNVPILAPSITIEGNAQVEGSLSVLGGITGPVSVTGDLNISGEVSADSAAFMTCLVDNSPVRTFANSSDGGGMQFPPEGIGVSTGSAWDDNSINFSWDANGSFAVSSASGLNIAHNLLTGYSEVDFINSMPSTTDHGGFNFYNATPGSTITGASPVLARIGHQLFQVWTIAQFHNSLSCDSAISTGSGLTVTGNAPLTPNTAALSFSSNNTYLDAVGANPATNGKFVLRSLSSDASINKSVLSINSNGDTALTGGLYAPGIFSGCNASANLGGTGLTLSSNPGGLTIGWNISSGTAEVDFFSTGSGAIAGGFQWFAGVPGTHFAPQASPLMSLDHSGNLSCAGSITGGSNLYGSNCFLNGCGIQSDGTHLLLNYAVGGGTSFGNGANGVVATMDAAGNLFCSGTVTAAGKSFRIPHPLDETKDLVHSCLEGPEWGVYYRGEVTTANGIAEVTLPDYFEALTYPEDRSVLLTVIVDDDNPVFGAGQIAAGRVKEGKFKVYSSDPSVTIAWEVKAVRRFGETKLQVVTDKPEPQPLPTLQDEKTEA